MADYHHPRSTLLGLMSAMYSLGAIVAVPFVPSIVDKFGRRYAILIGSIIMIIGGVLQGAALNYEWVMAFGTSGLFRNLEFLVTTFIIARFILGMGIVFAIVAASSLIGGVLQFL